MTEETTNSAVNAETTEKQATETFVPDWEKKAEKLEEMVKQGLGKQVGYKSVDGQVVEPILLTDEQNGNAYPIAIDKPVGFIAPAYSWFGEQRGYYETAPAYQGRKIQELTQGLNEIVKDQEQIKQEKEADQNKDSKQLQLMTMLLSQVGIMNKQVNDLNQKLATQPSAPVKTENATQPVQSTAATQPSTPVKTENATQPVQSTAATQPSTPVKTENATQPVQSTVANQPIAPAKDGE